MSVYNLYVMDGSARHLIFTTDDPENFNAAYPAATDHLHNLKQAGVVSSSAFINGGKAPSVLRRDVEELIKSRITRLYEKAFA